MLLLLRTLWKGFTLVEVLRQVGYDGPTPPLPEAIRAWAQA